MKWIIKSLTEVLDVFQALLGLYTGPVLAVYYKKTHILYCLIYTAKKSQLTRIKVRIKVPVACIRRSLQAQLQDTFSQISALKIVQYNYLQLFELVIIV